MAVLAAACGDLTQRLKRLFDEVRFALFGQAAYDVFAAEPAGQPAGQMPHKILAERSC